MEIDIIQMYYNLRDGDDEVKKAAYQDYKKIRGVPADTWIAQLHDDNPEKRAMAACALGVTRRKETIEQLLAALDDDSYLVRKSAAFSSSFMQNPIAIQPLIAALKDSCWEVRHEAIRSLMCLEDIAGDQKESIEEANLTVLKDPEPKVRMRATFYLRGFNEHRFDNELIAALSDEDSEVQCSALEALWLHFAFQYQEIRNLMLEKLHHPDKQVRIAAVHALEDAHPEDQIAHDALVKALHDPDADIRDAAAQTLNATSGIEASKAVACAIDDEDPRVKARAIAHSGYLGGDGVYEELINYLDDPESELRGGAAAGLLGLKDMRAMDRLIRLFYEDPDEIVRLTALTVINELDEEKNIDCYIKGLKDSSTIVRRYASSDIGFTHNVRLLEPLIDLLDDYDSEVRANAVGALGHMLRFAGLDDSGQYASSDEAASEIRKLVDEKATANIIDALDDIDHKVRKNAHETLCNMGSELAVEYLLKLAQNGDRSAEEALSYMKHPSLIEPMKELFKSEDPADRKHAVGILGMYHDDQLSDLLLTGVKDADPSVRSSSAYYLSYYKGPRITSAFLKLLDDKDAEVRVTAARSLRRTKSTRIVNALIKTLDDKDTRVREEAASSLSHIAKPEAEKALLDRFSIDRPEIVKSAYELFIRKGIPGTEQIFLDLLEQHGYDYADALAFCGNPILENAARNFYKVYCFPSEPEEDEDSPKWGSDRKE